MRVAVLKEPYQIEIANWPKPAIKSGEVLIRVRATGICGSDVHAYQGYHPRRKPPAVLGHELSGEIVDIGEGVNSLKVSDRVTVLPQTKCNSCYPCMNGWTSNMCENKTLLGTNRWPGSFSEYIVAPENLVYLLPDDIDYTLGALVEPLAVGLHTIQKALIGPTDRVLILGAGPIGLMCQLAAQAKGVKETIISDLSDFKLQVSEGLGAALVVNNSSEDIEAKLNDKYGSNAIDVAIIAASATELINKAFSIVKKQGRIALVGQFDKPGIIDIEKGRIKEQLIVGSSTYTEEDFSYAIELLQSKKFNFQLINSHYLSLEEINTGFEKILRDNTNTIKVMLNI